LVGLASEIGNGLDLLGGLERQVRGGAQEIATSVSERLDEDATDRDQRERALTERIAATIAESRAAVTDLADRLDTVARATAELPAIEDRLTAQLRDDLSGFRTDLDSSTRASRRATADALAMLS